MLSSYCFTSVEPSKSTEEQLKRSSISYSELLTIGFVLATKLHSVGLLVLPFQRIVPSPTTDLGDDW